MRMMRDPTVRSTNVAALLFGFGILAIFVTVPQFAQTPAHVGYGFGASVTQSGIYLLPFAVAMLIVAPLTARLSASIGSKPIQRYGLIGQWYIKKFDITTIYFHSSDNAYLGTQTAANTPLPVGARSPVWNGGLFESHYMFNPQLILINRYELVRMSQQALPTIAGNQGNIDVLTFGMRYYPFISSRAGFAYHAEYAIEWQKGTAPVPTLGPNLTTSSLLFGFDFAF